MDHTGAIANRRKRVRALVVMVLMGLGFLLSIWGAWDAHGLGDRLKVFRRLVGAFLFLFWSVERYRAYRRYGHGG